MGTFFFLMWLFSPWSWLLLLLLIAGIIKDIEDAAARRRERQRECGRLPPPGPPLRTADPPLA
jgi:hypothetical protein